MPNTRGNTLFHPTNENYIGGEFAGSLPDIFGRFGSVAYTALGGTDGVLFVEDGPAANIAATGNWSTRGISFKASRYSSIYGNQNVEAVIPKSLFIRFIVKYI